MPTDCKSECLDCLGVAWCSKDFGWSKVQASKKQPLWLGWAILSGYGAVLLTTKLNSSLLLFVLLCGEVCPGKLGPAKLDFTFQSRLVILITDMQHVQMPNSREQTNTETVQENKSWVRAKFKTFPGSARTDALWCCDDASLNFVQVIWRDLTSHQSSSLS